MSEKHYKYFDRTLTFFTNNSKWLLVLFGVGLGGSGIKLFDISQQPTENVISLPAEHDHPHSHAHIDHQPARHNHPHTHDLPNYDQRFKDIENRLSTVENDSQELKGHH